MCRAPGCICSCGPHAHPHEPAWAAAHAHAAQGVSCTLSVCEPALQGGHAVHPHGRGAHEGRHVVEHGRRQAHCGARHTAWTAVPAAFVPLGPCRALQRLQGCASMHLSPGVVTGTGRTTCISAAGLAASASAGVAIPWAAGGCRTKRGRPSSVPAPRGSPCQRRTDTTAAGATAGLRERGFEGEGG